MCSLIAPDTADLSVLFSRLYHTSISPESVRTSMIVCPKKSSDSLVNFCRNFDFKSLSSSHTRTLILSEELWHSLEKGVVVYIRITISKQDYSQMKLFVPYRIKLLRHSSCPLFHFANLHGYIGITCSTFVLCNQSLGAYNYNKINIITCC